MKVHPALTSRRDSDHGRTFRHESAPRICHKHPHGTDIESKQDRKAREGKQVTPSVGRVVILRYQIMHHVSLSLWLGNYDCHQQKRIMALMAYIPGRLAKTQPNDPTPAAISRHAIKECFKSQPWAASPSHQTHLDPHIWRPVALWKYALRAASVTLRWVATPLISLKARCRSPNRCRL